MAKPDGNAANNERDSKWGTWEELLLAFAVNRHGLNHWESVASELQKRNSDPVLSQSLTPNCCKRKYLDLKRRFASQTGGNNDKSTNDDADGDDADDNTDSVPLLEELRKLRVAELRREVRRYDLNIESLELKVKRMEEEREKSLSEKAQAKSDLKENEEIREKDGRTEKIEPDKALAEPVAGNLAGGEESDNKDQVSVNGSNSTDADRERVRSGEEGAEPDRAGDVKEEPEGTAALRVEPAGTGDLKAKPVRTGVEKAAREESCNGSSDSIEKESAHEVKGEPVSVSAELVESEAESKGGTEGGKENSDVQSSASRSRKEEDDKVFRGSTSLDERDNEDQSAAVKELSTESQPLTDLLEALRANKLGSVFVRGIQSQESSKYRNLIRQHVDLQMIEARLKEGWYSGSSPKFFRDVLLLVNNAIVFFNKNSSEYKAAIGLRKFISKEMSRKDSKSDSSHGKQVSLQSFSTAKKEDADPSQSLLLKQRIAGSLIVCRKRSSIAAKASGSSSGADKKKEPAEERDSKQQTSQPSGSGEEPKITKKRSRDRYASGSASSKKNIKNNVGSSSKSSPAESAKNHGKGGSSSQQPEPKGDSKKNQSTMDSKKRSAANFLNRMKESSSSNNGVLLDALKNTPLTSDGNSRGSEQRKSENTRRGEKKDQITKRTSEARQAKEKGSPAKRSVGRPPKRGAAPPPSLGKRSREKVEVESPPPKQPRKRTRKL